MSEAFTSNDESETEAVGRAIAERMGGKGVVLLFGDLGAGKTVLARGLASAVGVARSEVGSPTFTLVHEHQGARGRMTHVDLYRLSAEEAEAMGIDEVLAASGLRVVEWAERLPAAPPAAVCVRIARAADGVRSVRVDGLSDRPSREAAADTIEPGRGIRMEEARER